MTAYVRPALSLALLMTLVTGAMYPLAVTGIAQFAFPNRPMAAWCATPKGRYAGRP